MRKVLILDKECISEFIFNLNQASKSSKFIARLDYPDVFEFKKMDIAYTKDFSLDKLIGFLSNMFYVFDSPRNALCIRLVKKKNISNLEIIRSFKKWSKNNNKL